jgi:dTDP-6-deoxy-L-talose 4-dehydrogenase (NAD+)
MQKILVTGATGFIGEYVIRELQHKGHTVVTSSSNPGRAEQKSWFGSTDYRPFDFGMFDDSVDYYEYFGRPDRMIHLAWEGLPDYKNEKHITEYLPRHRAFLDNMIRHGLKNLTVTGTCLEYGMKEGCLKEDMFCDPVVPYAKAKKELQIVMEKRLRGTGVHFKWVRLFYMFGKGQNPRSLIPQLEQALAEGRPVFNMSPGEQKRDFLPVEKVAEYIAGIALQDRVTGCINCCSGQPVSVLAFVQDYLKKHRSVIQLNTGYYDYTDYEPMAFWGDTTKLYQALNIQR